MKTNLFPIVAIMAIALNTQAGSIKMPAGSNITRNAGQSIPISFTASGWPLSKTCNVWLMNAQTWTLDLIAIDLPVRNGVNTLNVQIPWEWDKPGKYLVRVTCSPTLATSTWYLTVRTAIKYPWSGAQWWPGALAAVTWVTDGLAFDSMAVTLTSEATGDDLDLLSDYYVADPLSGRYEFVVPNAPAGQYRVYIDGYIEGMEWDWETGEYWHYSELVQSTRSERIVIQ
jgi:hypothetical protein